MSEAREVIVLSMASGAWYHAETMRRAAHPGIDSITVTDMPETRWGVSPMTRNGALRLYVAAYRIV
ncbi:hypothetical protein MVI01_72190 [Myxococcus virescens]|uniref:Uncharacterized protein n=1 Tax=Myxococcus virescens TaxID=83456 RepID=A0A511HPZ0_9BACT|nr:hypothetical protein MVI01_72190 [Myxococcus virescens]